MTDIIVEKADPMTDIIVVMVTTMTDIIVDAVDPRTDILASEASPMTDIIGSGADPITDIIVILATQSSSLSSSQPALQSRPGLHFQVVVWYQLDSLIHR